MQIPTSSVTPRRSPRPDTEHQGKHRTILLLPRIVCKIGGEWRPLSPPCLAAGDRTIVAMWLLSDLAKPKIQHVLFPPFPLLRGRRVGPVRSSCLSCVALRQAIVLKSGTTIGLVRYAFVLLSMSSTTSGCKTCVSSRRCLLLACGHGGGRRVIIQSQGVKREAADLAFAKARPSS